MENAPLVKTTSESHIGMATKTPAQTTVHLVNNIAASHKAGPKTMTRQEPSLPSKLLAAGTAACIADIITFPLDTAKARLQIQGEGANPTTGSSSTSGAGATTGTKGGAGAAKYRGVIGTICTISKTEGPRALYNGLIPGLQRQMCFASVRIGLYDTVREAYSNLFGQTRPTVGVRILAGITTGGMAVICAQPTDVVKVRFQCQPAGVAPRYNGVMAAYKTIAVEEGVRGLWKGTSPNVVRNAIVNSAELVSYDLIKTQILAWDLLSDNMPCHFVSAFGAGFCTTVIASPVDVIKTRFMNSGAGTYSGVLDCANKMFKNEGFSAFYKGFTPSFMRLASWNVVMFVCYEQLKRAFTSSQTSSTVIPSLQLNSGPKRFV